MDEITQQSFDGNNTIYSVIFEEPTPWQLKISDGLIMHFKEGKQPNRFHRFMQRVFFGFVWSKN